MMYYTHIDIWHDTTKSWIWVFLTDKRAVTARSAGMHLIYCDMDLYVHEYNELRNQLQSLNNALTTLLGLSNDNGRTH